MAIADRKVDWGFTSVIPGQYGGTTVNQNQCRRDIARIGGHVQRGIAAPVTGIDVGAGTNQRGNGRGMPSQRRIKQWSGVEPRPGVDRNAGGNKDRSAFHGGHVQRGQTISVRRSEVGSPLIQLVESGDISESRCVQGFGNQAPGFHRILRPNAATPRWGRMPE